MSNGQFDEMQTQRRNQIGNQTFSLLVILLMLDTLLYNLGIRWMAYPMDVFIIVLLCCGIFIIRAALSDALVAPKQKKGKSIAVILSATVLSMAAVTVIGKFVNPSASSATGSGFGTILLEVISLGALFITAVIYFIKCHSEKNNDK